MAKLDIPLDALKLVAQHGPPDTNPSLTWTDENGFVLSMSVGGQMMPVRFDYGETLEDIKKEIQTVTGITLPAPEKNKKGGAPYEAPAQEKEASMRMPMLDGVTKKAAKTYKTKEELLKDHPDAQNILTLKSWPPKYTLAQDGTGPHGRGAGPGKGKADGSGLAKDTAKSASMKTPLLDKIAVLGDGFGGGGGQYDAIYNEMTGTRTAPKRTLRTAATAIRNAFTAAKAGAN